jgi:hypothetical protein
VCSLLCAMIRVTGTDKFILSEFDSAYNLDFSDYFTGVDGVFDVSQSLC